MRSTLLKPALAAASALILASTAVRAQTHSPARVSTDTGASVEVTEITITGSRIITNGNDAPTPVTVVNPDQLATTRPTTVFENLASLPMFSGSLGANNAPDNAPNGNTAVSALNLRNLGP
jgi:hypothetical protein